MAEMMRAMMGGMLILVLPAFLIFLGVAVITYRRRVGPGSGEAGGDGWDGGRGEGGEGGGGGGGPGDGGGRGGGGGGGGAGGAAGGAGAAGAARLRARSGRRPPGRAAGSPWDIAEGAAGLAAGLGRGVNRVEKVPDCGDFPRRWRRSQVVRQRSAKPRFVGSIPTGASLPATLRAHTTAAGRLAGSAASAVTITPSPSATPGAATAP